MPCQARLLRLNTAPAMDVELLADVRELEGKRNTELHKLGRLPYPMLRRRGEAGFKRVHWDEALDLVSRRLRACVPERLAVYMTSRSEPNENYYAAQKAARALGTNSIDTAARLCHAPSTLALKTAVGAAAATCSYSDLIGTDLVVFIGSKLAQDQPVMMKYLYHARKAGTKVAVVNTYREPAMERYWVPSNLESAIFGTKMTDRFFDVSVGGDIAFLNGVLKYVLEKGWEDHVFIDGFTSGFHETAAQLAAQSWESLERGSGTSREQMLGLAHMLSEAKTAVFVWSMGMTQHSFGEDAARAVVNLALSRGYVGREKCGLMPIGGHSGAHGGADMGAYATAFPGGLAVNEENAQHLSRLWGFPVPAAAGLTAPEMVDAAHEGRLDVLVSSGGNFLEVSPDPGYVKEALAPLPLRVHLDIAPVGADVRGTGRHRGAPPRPDPLRDGGRRHGDLDRAQGHIQPGDPRPQDRRSPPGMGGFHRTGPAGQARAGEVGPFRRHGRHQGRNCPGGPGLRSHRGDWQQRATSSSTAARCCAPAGSFPPPTGRHTSAPSPRRLARTPRALPGRHSPGTPVQWRRPADLLTGGTATARL